MFLWNIAVTSLAEVWIEIDNFPCKSLPSTVTSLAEVWIEIDEIEYSGEGEVSLPLRKCGLKYLIKQQFHFAGLVTSLAEVWIEIALQRLLQKPLQSLPLRKCGLKLFEEGLNLLECCHFPCGSVD